MVAAKTGRWAAWAAVAVLLVVVVVLAATRSDTSSQATPSQLERNPAELPTVALTIPGPSR